VRPGEHSENRQCGKNEQNGVQTSDAAQSASRVATRLHAIAFEVSPDRHRVVDDLDAGFLKKTGGGLPPDQGVVDTCPGLAVGVCTENSNPDIGEVRPKWRPNL